MKHGLIAFFGIHLLLISCGGSTEENQDAQSDDQVTDSTVEVMEEVPSGIYTNEEGDQVYEFNEKRLTITEFDRSDCIEFNVWNVVDETKLLDSDTSVYRNGDSLIFRLFNNTDKVLVNSVTESDNWSESGMYYQYQKDLSNIDFWVVNGYGYEYHETYLINKFNGDVTTTVGEVFVSPERRFVAVANSDMEANFTENHLSLYNWNADGLELIYKIGLDTSAWSPRALEWETDFKLIVTQGRFDESTYGINTNCAELKIEYLD